MTKRFDFGVCSICGSIHADYMECYYTKEQIAERGKENEKFVNEIKIYESRYITKVSCMTEIRYTKDKGRGVFATKDIPKGTRVFSNYYVAEAIEKVQHTIFDRYVYDYGDGNQVVMALGEGSLINHDNNHNCSFEFVGDQLTFTTVRDVKTGDELTIDYKWESYEW